MRFGVANHRPEVKDGHAKVSTAVYTCSANHGTQIAPAAALGPSFFRKFRIEEGPRPRWHGMWIA